MPTAQYDLVTLRNFIQSAHVLCALAKRYARHLGKQTKHRKRIAFVLEITHQRWAALAMAVGLRPRLRQR